MHAHSNYLICMHFIRITTVYHNDLLCVTAMYCVPCNNSIIASGEGAAIEQQWSSILNAAGFGRVYACMHVVSRKKACFLDHACMDIQMLPKLFVRL